MPTIDELYEAWRDAIRRGDVDAALELLTPDYVLWPAGAPPIEGREPVRALFTVALERYRIDPTFECEEGIESGDLAFERGWDVQTVEPRDGGPPQTSRQRVFLVLRRGEDGRWRYARGMSQPGPEGAQA